MSLHSALKSKFHFYYYFNIYKKVTKQSNILIKQCYRIKKWLKWCCQKKKAELVFLFNIGLSRLISKQAFFDFKNGFFISICQDGKLLMRRDIIAIWFSLTTVYRMSAFGAVHTHFESFLVTVHKFGILYTLVYRCCKICSVWTKFHEELSFLTHF